MTFENQLELNIKAFFFNADTDYLPYYKNFSFIINRQEDMDLKGLLKMIKEQNPNFSYQDKDLLFRVNNLVVTGVEKVKDVVEKIGTKLTIDPVLKYRSDNGLIFNSSDFMYQFDTLLKEYSKKGDLDYYLTLYPTHYASETFNYNHEYIGDAVLLMAHKMIQDDTTHQDEILDAINSKFNGISCCEYENNLFNGEDYSKIISELKEMIEARENFNPFNGIIRSILSKKAKSHDIDSIKGSNIALYIGDNLSNQEVKETASIIESSGAKFINFDMSTKLAGQTIIDSNRKMAYKKAGKMLLDALDSGANILAFKNDNDLKLFKSIHRDIEKAVGRDIELKLISILRVKDLCQKVEA
jgi:hypothetical protein